MKMDPEITDNINVEANYLVCTATELFIRHLSKEAYELDKRCLTYQNLAKYIQSDNKLDFLHDVVPNKITVREYKKILSEEVVRSPDGDTGSDDTSSDSSSDEESKESDEEEEEVEVKQVKKWESQSLD